MAGAWGVSACKTRGSGRRAEEAQGKVLHTGSARPASKLRLHISGSANKRTRNPELHKKVRIGRPCEPRFLRMYPRPCLHGELVAPFSLKDPPGLGARAKHEATDDSGGRHRLVSRARSPMQLPEPPRERSRGDVRTMPEARRS